MLEIVAREEHTPPLCSVFSFSSSRSAPGCFRAMCRRRADLVIENLALRQQLTALKNERPRPPLDDTDRAFWVALRSSWPAWASRLVIVNADTVARWIGIDSDDTGHGSRADAIQADLGLMPRFVGSSTRWRAMAHDGARWRKTAGAHLVSTPSSRSSDSLSVK